MTGAAVAPRLLAIDTTGDAVSVAIGAPGELVARVEPMTRGHADRLPTLIETARAAADLDWADLTRIIVCVGPAGFTGARVGVAAARAFGLALDRPVVGVDGFALYAQEAKQAGVEDPLIAFGAGRLIMWRRTSDEGAPTSGDAAAFQAALGGRSFVGPARIDGSAAPLARPETLAAIGALAPEQTEPPAPWYLRPPDAEPPKQTAAPRIDGD